MKRGARSPSQYASLRTESGLLISKTDCSEEPPTELMKLEARGLELEAKVGKSVIATELLKYCPFRG